MKRADVINLLKEIMSSCASFTSAQAVSIGKNPNKTDSHFLTAKWSVNECDRPYVNELAKKYGVEILETDGFTLFSRKP